MNKVRMRVLTTDPNTTSKKKKKRPTNKVHTRSSDIS